MPAAAPRLLLLGSLAAVVVAPSVFAAGFAAFASSAARRHGSEPIFGRRADGFKRSALPPSCEPPRASRAATRVRGCGAAAMDETQILACTFTNETFVEAPAAQPDGEAVPVADLLCDDGTTLPLMFGARLAALHAAAAARRTPKVPKFHPRALARAPPRAGRPLTRATRQGVTSSRARVARRPTRRRLPRGAPRRPRKGSARASTVRGQRRARRQPAQSTARDTSAPGPRFGLLPTHRSLR